MSIADEWGLQAGDILLLDPTDHPSIYTRIVRMFTGSRYTHAMVYDGADGVIEALADGMAVSPLETYYGHANLGVCRIPATPEQLLDIVHGMRLWAVVKTRYGYRDIVRLGLRRKGLPYLGASDVRRLFCSEAIATVFWEMSGIRLTERPFDEVTPGDLASWLTYVIPDPLREPGRPRHREAGPLRPDGRHKWKGNR